VTSSKGRTPLVGALPIARIDTARVFSTAYADLKKSLRGRKAGALIAMLDPSGRVHGRVWIRARRDRPRCAIVGRHEHCAVPVRHAQELSLRHAAVLVRAVDHGVELRVLDLLSGWGFFGEDGEPLESVTTDGTSFFQIGGYVLAVIVTGGFEWPDQAIDAYARIPPRELHDARRLEFEPKSKSVNTKVKQMSGVVRLPMEEAARLDAQSNETGHFVAPQDLSYDDAPEDEIRRELEASFRRALVGSTGALGELVITAEGRHEVVAIGREALDRGIVLGRYSRTARHGLAPLSSSTLSRVHLLVTRSEDRVLAYDTASANGSWDRSLVANGAELSKGRVVRLGTGQAYVSWV
jgi:hypothetical protein